MSRNQTLWGIAIATGILILGALNFYPLLDWAASWKREFLLLVLIGTIAAAGLEAAALAIKFDRDPPTLDDKVGVVAKLAAALVIIFAILSQAEDLSGVEAADIPIEIAPHASEAQPASLSRDVGQALPAPTHSVTPPVSIPAGSSPGSHSRTRQ